MDNLTPLERAKEPRTVLAGPYGHPFHPILITIPIGAWISSLVFDVIAAASDDPEPFVVGDDCHHPYGAQPGCGGFVRYQLFRAGRLGS